MIDIEEQTRFQAVLKYRLSRENNWSRVVKSVLGIKPGSTWTIYDLSKLTGIDIKNLYHILHGSGPYRKNPSLVHGKYQILSRIKDFDTSAVIYVFIERRREELSPLID